MPNRTMTLLDRVAVVTGGAQGIGRAVAERFRVEGARVVVLDVADRPPRLPAEISFLHCDVGDEMAVTDTFERIREEFGGVKIVVNNAAILSPAPFLETKIDDFDQVLRVNLRGAFLVGLHAAKQMASAGFGGSIINMSSINAVVASENQTAYATSKGGIHMLTRSMAVQLAPHRIRVNAIGPGTIATEMALNHVDDALLNRIPMHRLGDPDEVAAVASFLASDDASYITGQTIYVDGGRLALNLRRAGQMSHISLPRSPSI